MVFTSLQSALKKAIQAIYQLEDNELAAEPLPSSDDRRRILLYEASARAGAGVLRRLLDEPSALEDLAREALRICHFDPATGRDERRAEGATEDCEAACYDCLMTYANQRDHPLLDRQQVREILLDLARCKLRASPSIYTFAEHLASLRQQAGSDLERAWLDHLARRGLNLPGAAQRFVEKVGTRPDFFYDKHKAAIYVDGPTHDFPDRQQRDREVTTKMEDAGFIVIRFGHAADWDKILADHPNLFGKPQSVQTGTLREHEMKATGPSGVEP